MEAQRRTTAEYRNQHDLHGERSRRIFFLFIHNITGRKQAEQALRESEERFRSMLDQNISAMFVVEDGMLTYANRRAGEILGYSAAELIGRAMLDLVVEPDRPNIAEAMRQLLSGEQKSVERSFGALRQDGTVHDIGKISVPAEILSKPSRLTSTEFELIKGHSQSGHDVLKGVDFPWPLAEVILQHHERLDGSGYPRQLKDGEIILEARIMAVADVVEAMSSHRPYRPGLGIDAALEEIRTNSGKFYDPQVAAACLRLFREQGYVLAE